MNRKMILGVATVALLGLASCNCGNNCGDGKACANGAGKDGNDKEVLYTGILPNADAQGTVYTLKLEYDADHNYNEGDFTMVENSLGTDTVAAAGIKVLASSYASGDFRKESKEIDGATVNYIRLLPDAKDALGTPTDANLYFLINEDESLTMVNADLQKSEVQGLNFTLSVFK